MMRTRPVQVVIYYQEKVHQVLLIICILNDVCSGTQNENCPRTLEFNNSVYGRVLTRHVIKRIPITSPDVCQINCFTEADCASFNVVPLRDGSLECHLSNSDHRINPEHMIYEAGATYTPVVNHCSSNPCPVNSRCQAGYTTKGYRCICTEGFTGADCNDVIPVAVTVSPKAISTKKGRLVIFTCSATGSPKPTVTWSKLQGTLDSVRSSISRGKLTILNVTAANIGSYECYATNTIGTNASTVELRVFCSLVSLTKSNSSAVLYVGQALKISCPASAGAMPLWKYNGTTSLPQESLFETPDVLLFPSLRKNHVGHFSCSSGDSLALNVNLFVKYPETCTTVKQYVCDVSGNYVIDPDGEEGEAPFTVYCNMIDKGRVGVTAVSHDSENRTLITGLESPGSYSRDIRYTASLSQIQGLKAVSKKCQQSFKYECNHAMFHYQSADRIYAWWISAEGERMLYWSEAIEPTRGCECGATSSCVDPQKFCNCDENDYVWREDSGLLTNKTHIPVTQLRFGDTGDPGEEAYHTLGKLVCYGLN